MKNYLPILAAAGLALSSFSTFAGALESYFPLDTGQNLYVYDVSLPLTLSFDDYGMTEAYGSKSATLDLAEDTTNDICYFTGATVGWTHVSFNPEVVMLNDNILENGGTVRTSTRASQTGISYPATYTIRVSKVASVTVPAGTYTNCRSFTCTEVADVRGQTVTASALTAYLAPGVGIVKMLLPGGVWAELAGPNYSLITVGVGPGGTVTPNYNGHLLKIGQRYTMTAKPKAENVFGSWTDGDGDTVCTTEKYTFTMTGDLALNVNFVPNPFLAPAGAYTGLFSPSSGATVENSGYFALTATTTGAFSGYLQTGDTRHPISGRFDGGGSITKTLNVAGQSPWTVTLNLDLSGGGDISGTVITGSGTADLTGNKSVFNAGKDSTSHAGKYTMIFDGINGSATLPGGDGYASVTIGKAGGIALSGFLADGSKITPSTTLSQYGDWPFYASLNGGAGCVSGWLTVGGSGAISGTVDWIKPGASSGNYPGGFTFSTAASGGIYVDSDAITSFDFTQAVFSGGALAGGFANQISIASNHKVTNLSANKLTMTFSPSTGIFQGAVVNPSAPGSTAMPFGGVLLQSQSTALGCFLDASQSGTFTLESH